MASGNPALTKKTFNTLPATTGARMTLNGTVHKTAILLLLTMASAFVSWRSGYMMLAQTYDPMGSLGPWILGASIGGLVVALAIRHLLIWQIG